MPLAYKKMSDADWKAMPQTQAAKKPNEWEDLVDHLETGETLSVDVPGDRNIKGVRIAIARLAARRQMKLEFRQNGQKLAMRKSGPYVPKTPREEDAKSGGRGSSRR